ncbi:hypothetical protein [Caulobacter sp. NIBR1757]|uniref:hypothetical protein n=1 Tax=Caulobacter sp. NIBR1757 TaxID=3016000 RepID=UPI0022F08A90|nr:hypothetical protein [Caulobacter sp. NIBR1757]WGM41028.1 hypothetical protein AMEJIAPC_03976 [Caulobacter sp. NIBR1757]
MIAFALSMMLLVAQATPAPAEAKPPPAADAPAATAPAAPVAPAKPAPPSQKLEDTLTALKGRPKAHFTSKLGPPASVRPAIDGEVLIWSVKVAGATVCAPNAAGSLVCGRQGDGECQVVIAFSKADAMTVWRNNGVAMACDKAADMFSAPVVTLPKLKKPKPGQ